MDQTGKPPPWLTPELRAPYFVARSLAGATDYARSIGISPRQWRWLSPGGPMLRGTHEPVVVFLPGWFDAWPRGARDELTRQLAASRATEYHIEDEAADIDRATLVPPIMRGGYETGWPA